MPPTSNCSPVAPGPRPTRVRWHIIAMLAVITALTYVDRLNLSIAGKYIQDEFAFNTQTMGWILSAFVLGYALFQVPGGWLGDRYGPRGMLTFAILWWSVFTAATGIAPRLPFVGWFGLVWSFAIVRFLVGVGEAGAFPNTNKIIALWIGPSQRGIASSLFIAGVGAGGALTPMLITIIMQHWGWRTSFYICAAAGTITASGWRMYATNRPEEHSRVNREELALIRSTRAASPYSSQTVLTQPRAAPWARILSSSTVWALILSYFCIAYPAYIYYTWFFIYLVRVRGLTVTQGSIWGSTPFLGILMLAPLGGWLSDHAVIMLGLQRGRQCAVWAGVTCSATLLWAGSHTANNTAAILMLAGAAGFNLFATATWWATCVDLTRNFSGSLSGLMNMCGNLGGALSPILTARIATRLGWTQALDFAAFVTLAAGVIWLLVNASEDLEV